MQLMQCSATKRVGTLLKYFINEQDMTETGTVMADQPDDGHHRPDQTDSEMLHVHRASKHTPSAPANSFIFFCDPSSVSSS